MTNTTFKRPHGLHKIISERVFTSQEFNRLHKYYETSFENNFKIYGASSVSTVMLQIFFVLAVSVGRVVTMPTVTARVCRSESTDGLHYASLNAFVLMVTTSPSRSGPPHYGGFTITDTLNSEGLPWTSDQPHAETST